MFQEGARGSALGDVSIELLAVFALKFICDTQSLKDQARAHRTARGEIRNWHDVVNQAEGWVLAGRLLKLAHTIESEIEPLQNVFTRGLLSDFERWQPNFLHHVIFQLSAFSTSYVDDHGVPAFARWFDKSLSALMGSGVVAAESATPLSLAELMTSLADLQPNLTVLDPCCGIGTLLTQAAQIMCTPGEGCSLYGQEINHRSWALCRLRLFLLRYSVEHVTLGDTLRQPAFVSHEALMRFDRVLCDMPLGRQFSSEELKFDPYCRFMFLAKGKIPSESAFIQHAISSLKNNGVGIVLVSHGFLFRTGMDSRLREELVENGYITAIIGLPGKLLTKTSIETALILFEKRPHTGVLFIDAAQMQDQVRGKTEISAETRQRIYSLLYERQEEPGVSHLASLEEIKRTKYSLVPKHYISAPMESARDVESLRTKLHIWEGEQQQLVEEMDQLLRDLRRDD